MKFLIGLIAPHNDLWRSLKYFYKGQHRGTTCLIDLVDMINNILVEKKIVNKNVSIHCNTERLKNWILFKLTIKAVYSS